MASHNYDVVVVGASFGGVAAALAAAADPKVTVALLEPSDWIGGQATSQGVTRWDEAGMELMETTGSTKSYRELRDAIRGWYRANAPLSPYGKGEQYFNPGFARPDYPFAVDPAVAALRRKLKAVADDTLRKDEAYAVITAAGQCHVAHIPHASGTADNPMSDAAIEAKFLANATPVIGRERAERARDFVWSLEKQRDVRALAALLA